MLLYIACVGTVVLVAALYSHETRTVVRNVVIQGVTAYIIPLSDLIGRIHTLAESSRYKAF